MSYNIAFASDKIFHDFCHGKFYSSLKPDNTSYICYYAEALKSIIKANVVDFYDTLPHGKFIMFIKLDMRYFEYLVNTYYNQSNERVAAIIEIINKLAIALNEERCMLVFDTCTWPMIPSQHKIGINRLYTFLKIANVTCLKNVIFLTSAHMNREASYTGLFKTIFFEFFENALRTRKQSTTNFNKKIQNFTNNTNTFRFLYLNHKEKAHRVYLFIKIFLTVKDFYKKIAASMCPGRVLFTKENGGIQYHVFQSDLTDFVDKSIPDWVYNSSRDEFVENFSKLVQRPGGSISTPLAPWAPNSDWKSPKVQWTLDADLWEKTGVYIGVETNYVYSKEHAKDGNDYLSLTEKTFKPIMMKAPFILYGQPFILKKLKEYGYKTFSDFWDESYDEELDHMKRASSIVKVVKTIADLSDREFVNLLLQTENIVEHNYRVFCERRPEKEICDTIVKFYEEKNN